MTAELFLVGWLAVSGWRRSGAAPSPAFKRRLRKTGQPQPLKVRTLTAAANVVGLSLGWPLLPSTAVVD